MHKPRKPQGKPGRQKNQPAASQADKNRATDQSNQNRVGEDRNQNRTDATIRKSETTANRSSDKPLDGQLASCLLIGNQKEVAISQFAAERSKNEKVKEFARQMVKDHSQAITMLQRFAGPDASKDLSANVDSTRVQRSETTVNRSATSPEANRSSAEGEQREVNRDATNPSDRNRTEATVQVRTEHEAMPDKMLAIQREVAQKCITMAKHELEQSSNFDQAYVGMQISAHMGMIAHLETYKSYASQDLGKVIQESLDTAQGHLRHAKELVTEISQVSSSSRSSTSSRNDATNRTDAPKSNPANRDDAGTRREGADNKKDAPKS